ncbi:MAG: flagellar hook-length control protein FliK [Lachnospiraceae bacterium]|jgi:hypothetical protein|nr:flagellar hook-length control protein FliK [Lachnospiraceae bacterium]
MSFNLSGLFTNNPIQSVTPAKETQLNARQNSITSGASGNVAGMTNGSQISGEVVSVNGKDIVIRMAKGEMLSAKLSADMNVEPGQQMTFEVQKNASGQVALRALYANLDINPTALKALDMANIPVRENTIAMVDAMMREGMSIGSESLQKMYHEIAKNPEASGNAIVSLSRLGIPVNRETISQHESYVNLEHQIDGAVGELGEEIAEMTKALFAMGEDGQAMKFQSQILDLFAGSDVDWIADLSKMEEAAEGADGAEKLIQPENLSGPKAQLSSAQMEELSDLMKQLGGSVELTDAMAKGEISPKQYLSLVNQMLGQAEAFASKEEKTLLAKLIQSPSFGKLLTGQMKEELSFKPEEMLSREKVQQFYDKLQNRLAVMAQNLPEYGKAAQPLQQGVSHLQQNLAFMQQINYMADYVQLPMKMNGGNTNGELYVYTNKKNLAGDEGTLSAFLHLDMTHMGPVDVYVAMSNGNHVKTNFYLASDEMLDFVGEHIHILDERLAARGYHMDVTLTEKEPGKPFGVLEELKKDKTENGMVSTKIASYAFDVRA